MSIAESQMSLIKSSFSLTVGVKEPSSSFRFISRISNNRQSSYSSSKVKIVFRILPSNEDDLRSGIQWDLAATDFHFLSSYWAWADITYVLVIGFKKFQSVHAWQVKTKRCSIAWWLSFFLCSPGTWTNAQQPKTLRYSACGIVLKNFSCSVFLWVFTFGVLLWRYDVFPLKLQDPKSHCQYLNPSALPSLVLAPFY